MAKRLFLGSVKPAVYDLHSLRERMILIGNFILPGAETTSAEDTPFLERRKKLRESAVAAEGRCRVSPLNSAVPGVMDLLSTLDETRRDETLGRCPRRCCAHRRA
jgi:hypothetical protein